MSCPTEPATAASRQCRCCATCTWAAGDIISTDELLEAASCGNFHVIRHAVCVLGEGIMDKQDEDGMTALHLASKRGHLPVVKFLLHCVDGSASSACTQPCCCHADEGSRSSPSFASFSSNGTSSRPSSTSSSVGRIAKPRAAGPAADFVTRDGVAAKQGSADNSSSESFSKPTAPTSSSMTSKSTASGASNAQLSSALSDALSDSPNACVEAPAATTAVVAKTTADANAWASRVSARGHTAMHWAAIKGHASVVNELINHGFDVDARSKLGATPLHMAVAAEKVEVASLLLNAGADPNPRTNSGSTPTAAATYLRNSELLRLLSSSSLRAQGAAVV